MVTALYWVLLWPVVDKDVVVSTDITKHTVPLFVLVIEFLTNNLVIETRMFVPVLFWFMCYTIVVVGYTTTGDRYVYSVLKLED